MKQGGSASLAQSVEAKPSDAAFAGSMLGGNVRRFLAAQQSCF
jgi:hypothetical protein